MTMTATHNLPRERFVTSVDTLVNGKLVVEAPEGLLRERQVEEIAAFVVQAQGMIEHVSGSVTLNNREGISASFQGTFQYSNLQWVEFCGWTFPAVMLFDEEAGEEILRLMA